MANDVYFFTQGRKVMEWLLIVIGGVMVGGALITTVSLVLQDMRVARLHRPTQNNHPEHLQRRPLVSIVIDEEPTNESIASLRHGDYRKIEIVYVGEETHGDLMLPVNPDIIVEKSLLTKAINRFNVNPQTQAIEIIPRPNTPDNLRDLLRLYRQIVSAPFIAVRAMFRVVPIWGSGWPVMINLHEKIPEWRARVYAFARWVTSVINTFALIYSLYVAIVYRRPEFLILYAGLFIIWLITAIWVYPHFALRQKIVSLILAPVSFGYFLVLGIVTPFTSIRYSTRDAFARLWRSPHQRYNNISGHRKNSHI